MYYYGVFEHFQKFVICKPLNRLLSNFILRKLLVRIFYIKFNAFKCTKNEDQLEQYKNRISKKRNSKRTLAQSILDGAYITMEFLRIF